MEPSQRNERGAFLVVLIALGIAFLFLVRPVLVTVCLGAIICTLLYPLYAMVLKFCRGKKYIASFVSTFLIFLILVLPSGLMTALVVNQIFDVVSDLNASGVFSFWTSQEFYQTHVGPLLTSLYERFKIEIDFGGLLTRVGKEAALYVYNFSPQVLGQTGLFVFNFFVMHFSIFFLFIEGPGIWRALLDLSPLKAKHEKRLTGELKNMIYGTVYGYLATAFVQGVLAGLGFWIAGVPAFMVFGTLTFFMSMVPIVGATSVWLPIAVWIFIQGKTGWGIFMVIYGLVAISGIDNVIKPLIIQERTKIHPLLIFFALFGGIQLFGPIGILFGPVIMALFLASVRIYREDFLKT
ncbi:MAG: AI-2E family transporter [Deltaproteobacteria bacterium]|nr:AI-2E family transporter [Deltaproteobacteria bacterium]